MLQEDKIIEEFNDLSEIREVMEPWSSPLMDTPEDEEIPTPCAFTDALHYMEMSHDEALSEFYSLFDSHVDPDFAKSQPVFALLKEHSSVFVPSNWEGISGVQDIELNWLPGLPEKMKPKARPINPKLWDNAIPSNHSFICIVRQWDQDQSHWFLFNLWTIQPI